MSRKHFRLSPSSMSRQIACPGSRKLCQGKASVSSVYAEAGTHAHDVAEQLVLGREVTESDKEVLDAVNVYVQEINAYRAAYDVIVEHTERTLECLTLPDLGGTSDHFMVYVDDQDRVVLHIFDYKHGQGVVVSAEENKQLLSYCVIIESHYEGLIDHFRMTIVQPRAFEGEPVQTWECGIDRVREHAKQIVDSLDKDTLAAGDHCRWCLAKLTCPLLAEMASKAASEEIENIRKDRERLIELYEQAPAIKALLDAVPVAMLSHFKAGEGIPGFKVIERTSHRHWVNRSDEAATLNLLEARGISEDEATRKVLLTPPQLEKVVPGKKKEIAEIVTKSVIGYAVVPEGHRSKAVDLTSVSDFTEISEDGI